MGTKEVRVALPRTADASGGTFQMQLSLRFGTSTSNSARPVMASKDVSEDNVVKRVTEVGLSGADSRPAVDLKQEVNVDDKRKVGTSEAPGPVVSEVTTQLVELDIDEVID